jgi:hypothetical protein
MAYQANNIRGQWTRAFASATLVGFGGIGGIAGSLIFRSQDAPDYIPGIWGAMAYVEPFPFPEPSWFPIICVWWVYLMLTRWIALQLPIPPPHRRVIAQRVLLVVESQGGSRREDYRRIA